MLVVALISKAYVAFIQALAGLACGLLAAVFLMIVYDVSVRTLGFQPPYWVSALTEYALLFMTMLAAPWLVRRKSHVFVTSLISVLPALFRLVAAKAVYLACIVICLAISYYAAVMGIEAFELGEYDVRSIDMPRWLLFASLPVGLTLSAVEFARYLFGPDDMYAGADTEII